VKWAIAWVALWVILAGLEKSPIREVAVPLAWVLVVTATIAMWTPATTEIHDLLTNSADTPSTPPGAPTGLGAAQNGAVGVS
jgi:hypothetical protein